MASVNFEKLKTPQEVKAMFRHCDKEQRKTTVNHSNKQIDKTLTDKNMQYRGRGYRETCKLYDEKMAYLDSLEGQNKRKDRVTCFGLEIPFPKDLDESKGAEWVKKVNRILQERYEDNLLNVYVHHDEKHTYVDATTGKKTESRSHIHAYVIPAINDKLNGKAFSSKKSMISLNNSIQEMTQHDFGIDFMDGTKKKSKESVERLKERSKRKALEQVQKDYENRLKLLDAREQDISNREQALNVREEVLQEKEREITVLQEKALKMQNTALQREAEARELKNTLSSQIEANRQAISAGKRAMAEQFEERTCRTARRPLPHGYEMP